MKQSFIKGPPYHRFSDFIAPGADRLNILLSLLDELELPSTAVNIAGNCHLFVVGHTPGAVPENNSRSAPRQTQITLIAHYDRAKGSPGANDNSAAVFQLLETAVRLREKGVDGWRIIFTDKEELTRGESVQNQGAYTLAKALREAGRGEGRFFIFDACGVGDTLIISTITDHVIKFEEGLIIAQIRKEAKELRNRALETARRLAMDKVLLAPIPFSDDLGFFRAGITAQTITVLPSKEAAALSANLHKEGFADTLISREAQRPSLASLVPETWRSLNGPEDRPGRLTPQHYKMVVRFACALCT
jgi:hypothetical protein